MQYLFAIVAAILLLDVIRSSIQLRKVSKIFFAEHQKKKESGVQTFGTGSAFHLAIVGDSTFDVRGDTKVPFGPAQVIVDKLAMHHTVHVHLLAQAGAKSYDVTAKQLPKLKALSKVDLVVAYMGANNAVYFKSPFTIGKDYRELLAYTEAKAIPVAASEVANYWQFGLFSWVHRTWLYVAVHIENALVRRAFRGATYASCATLKPVHKAIHKKRREEPYLLDGYHPNDASCITFGNIMYDQVIKNPVIAALFKD